MKGRDLRAVSAALVLTTALSALPVRAAQAPASFSDVPENHWAAASIAAVCDMGIMQGVGEGRFEPERVISGAEFLVMLVRQLQPEGVDMSVGGAWYVPYLYAGVDLLGRTSYSGVLEAPAMLEGPLTRYDMAGMAVRALDGASYADPARIADWDSVPDEYKDVVAAGVGTGLLRGVDDRGTFNGRGTMTRAEAAVVMERLTAALAAQRTTAPIPDGAMFIDRSNAQVEAADIPGGFYIYSHPYGEGGADVQGRLTFDNPGYTRLRFTMTTGSTLYESSHTFRVFDVSAPERELLFYITQRSDAVRTYEIDVTGVSRIDLSICRTCHCEAGITGLCLY